VVLDGGDHVLTGCAYVTLGLLGTTSSCRDDTRSDEWRYLEIVNSDGLRETIGERMSLRSRLICLGATCGALVTFSAAPAFASVTPLTITGTSGSVAVSNGVGDNTVTATPDAGPLTFTARTGLAFPVHVIGQDNLGCEDGSGLQSFTTSFDSPYETTESSSVTWQPATCPSGEVPVYHQVTAQAQETYQLLVIGRGFETVTVTTGDVEFSWVFPQ
jgi:hypothetical protein